MKTVQVKRATVAYGDGKLIIAREGSTHARELDYAEIEKISKFEKDIVITHTSGMLMINF